MIPKFLKPFLWWLDTDKMDIGRDKKRIITNILNYGTKKAIGWLFKTYSKEDIKKVVENPLPGEWDKKSLNFWRIFFGIKSGDFPKRKIPQ